MNLKFLETDTFFGCLSLKTGAATIAVLHIMTGFLLTIDSVYSAINNFRSVSLHLPEDKHLHIVHSYSAACSLQLIFGIYFFIGALKGNKAYVLSGFILDVTGFVMSFTMAAFPLIFFIIDGQMGISKAIVIAELAPHVIGLYLLVVVYNYYRVLCIQSQARPADSLLDSTGDINVENF